MGIIIRTKLHLSIWVIFASLICAVIVVWPKSAEAETNTSWSWSDIKPTVFSSNTITDMTPSTCPNSYQIQNIAGESDTKKVCISKDNFVSFGIYYANSAFRPVVSFSYDSKMYRVNGICGQYDNCLYLPSSDTLVTKQYLINGIVRSLVIYNNFTDRLKQSFNTSSVTMEYNFDTANPDYTFQSDSGYAWPVGGIGASDNGKWLAIEFRQRGIGLLNIETMQMKRISTMSFSYGTGYDPTSELSVSNDGRYVAVMGQNAGLTVFDVNSNCGDEATSERIDSVNPISKPCKSSPIDTEDFIYRFYSATHPKFNDDGGELTFYATSYTNEIREVSLRAARYGGQRLDYLAMGDSFSSGEGETYDGNYLDGTNNEFEKCHISIRSYPFLIARLSGIDPNYMRSVACSGATTADIIGDDYEYWGQDNRFNKDGLNLNNTDRILYQTEAKELFLPGRIPQERFVEEYQPKVITIGIGGNDAGFMQKLKSCLNPDTCNWAIDLDRKEQTAVEIKNLFNTLVNMYSELHNTSPNSKIYVVGYPKIIDENSECGPLIGYLLDKTERQFMNEGIIYLNQVIEAAARKVGIKYLDIQDIYGDHVLCNKAQPSAMNAIRTGDDNAIIDQINWFKIIGQESFHPNSLGHYYAAQSIFASIGDITLFRYCADGAAICPDDIASPEPSSYWIPETYHNYPLQKSTALLSDDQNNSDNRQKHLALPSRSLQPDSSVDIEINSTQQELGQFYSTNDGALDVDIILPISLEEGYHTLHIYGTSYSGELVDLYQVIKYQKPTIADSSQPEFKINIDKTTEEPTDGNTNRSDLSSKPSTSTLIIKGFDVNTRLNNSNYINKDDETKITQYETAFPVNAQMVLGDSISNTDNIKENNKERPNIAPAYLLTIVGITIIGLSLIIKRKY